MVLSHQTIIKFSFLLERRDSNNFLILFFIYVILELILKN